MLVGVLGLREITSLLLKNAPPLLEGMLHGNNPCMNGTKAPPTVNAIV